MSNTSEILYTKKAYTTKIIKAGALLTDTKTLLTTWNETLSTQENLQRIRRENIFGKASRSRIEDILTIFRQRYLTSEAVTLSLVHLIRGNFPREGLDRILYFYSTQSDALLHDIVVQVFPQFRAKGKRDVTVSDLQAVINNWISEGKIPTQWSEVTILRVVQEMLSTLRDFGILQGASHKRLAHIYLPVEAFAYIAFYLQQSQPSGERLLHDPEWQLFFLSHDMVEHFFMEAHQHHLLEYHAAGSVIRITFPQTSLEEYAYALTQRSY
jgi:hypothetical protein